MVLFFYSTKRTLVAYKAKSSGQVCINLGMVGNDVKKKPKIVHYFNSTRAGVDIDIADKMLREYSSKAATRPGLWPYFIILSIFAH